MKTTSNEAAEFNVGETTMSKDRTADNIRLKHKVVQTCRSIAGTHNFLEVNTPTIRTATSNAAPRRRVIVDEPYAACADAFLKTSHDTALRTLLRFCPRVFEMNPCFRMDSPDYTHYPEFLLAEFAAGGVDFQFFLDLAQHVVSSLFGGEAQLERISVRNHILSTVGIDIATCSNEALKAALIDSSPAEYSRFAGLPTFYVVNQYVSDKIEPQTGIALVTEYPLCTISKAKRIGDTNMIHRFEAFINGLEVAHSYLYEENVADYVQRSKENNHYNSEIDTTAAMMDAGLLPAVSGILGFGVERLCCALTGKDIADFVFAKEFGFVAQEACI
jgi:lysyl-tRNA synthetase class 2